MTLNELPANNVYSSTSRELVGKVQIVQAKIDIHYENSCVVYCTVVPKEQDAIFISIYFVYVLKNFLIPFFQSWQ